MSAVPVFISYAHEDRAFVDTLAKRLEAAGVSVWYDRNLTPGRAWSQELEERIQEAQAVVVVLSLSSVASDYVRKEIHFSEGVSKRFVPVLLQVCPVPLPLSDLQWIDARDGRDPLPGVLAALSGEASPALQPPEVLPQPPPPVELRLNVQRVGESLQARLTCENLDAGPFPFTSPLTPKDLNELRWYLETYWRWPIGPDVKRGAALESQLKEWGKALFDSVFDNREALRLYQQFRDRADRPRLLTLDTTEPAVLRLPWELLADEEGHLFAIGVPLRRRVHKVQAAEQEPFELPLRILMVVARPNDERTPFIDPRASSKALLKAVAPLGAENVVVEFLHPPTLQTLNQRLRDSHKPPVHVVHFDGHGVYHKDKGLGTLAFEDEKGELDLVDADRLGNLLTAAKIPLMILDACQSAHADTPDPFTSLAPRLIQSGVGSVVAMQYSVLVETTRRFFAAFYRALADGRTVGQAMDEGRRVLLADTKRFTLYRPGEGETPLHLRDWFLPALYQQTADVAPFAGAVIRPAIRHDAAARRHSERSEESRREMLPSVRHSERSEESRRLEILRCAQNDIRLHGEFPEPPYPFIGRSRELWQLERHLRERCIVVVHGFGGQGKTALTTEAAGWLTRTGLFARALFLSFKQGGDADGKPAASQRFLLSAPSRTPPRLEAGARRSRTQCVRADAHRLGQL